MPKLIREIRMGLPKSYKTGAVVSTYPKPALVLEGDEGGLDVVKQPIVYRTESEILADCNRDAGSLPPITAFNFVDKKAQSLDEIYAVTKDPSSFPAFNRVGNALLRKCPWRTVILDPITKLTDAVFGHLAVAQPGQLNDARKWAASVGLKVIQTIANLNNLPCHFVCIMHTAIEKNETTGEVLYEPIFYSKQRNLIAAQPSQFFYADIISGKPVVYTQPHGYIKGIGARWPEGLPNPCGALFNDIYGKAVQSGETTA